MVGEDRLGHGSAEARSRRRPPGPLAGRTSTRSSVRSVANPCRSQNRCTATGSYAGYARRNHPPNVDRVASLSRMHAMPPGRSTRPTSASPGSQPAPKKYAHRACTMSTLLSCKGSDSALAASTDAGCPKRRHPLARPHDEAEVGLDAHDTRPQPSQPGEVEARAAAHVEDVRPMPWSESVDRRLDRARLVGGEVLQLVDVGRVPDVGAADHDERRAFLAADVAAWTAVTDVGGRSGTAPFPRTFTAPVGVHLPLGLALPGSLRRLGDLRRSRRLGRGRAPHGCAGSFAPATGGATRLRGTRVRRPPTVPASTVAGCTRSGMSCRAPAERVRFTVSRCASQRTTSAAYASLLP